MLNRISATELDNWSRNNPRQAQEILPELVIRLVLATSDKIIRHNFSIEKGIQYAGYDGVLESEEKSNFFPKGKSVWECGTNENLIQKFDDDIKKRTQNPLVVDIVSTTFIFVTLKLWNHRKSIEEKINESKSKYHWSDIQIFDASKMCLWIEKCPAVSNWMVSVMGKSINGVYTVEQFWEEYATSTIPFLKEEFFLIGRDKEKEIISSWLTEKNGCHVLKAESDLEAIMFLIATIYNFESKEEVINRALVVKNAEAWNSLIKTHDNKTLLIPLFNLTDEIKIPSSLFIIIPVSYFSPISKIERGDKSVSLIKRYKNDYHKALETLGLDSERISLLERNTKRSFIYLYREITNEISKKQPSWLSKTNVEILIPALLAGAWDGDFKGDKKLIELLSGEKYDIYISKLTEWINMEESPVFRVRNTFQIISIPNLWMFMFDKVTEEYMRRFEESALIIFGYVSPKFELAEEEQAFAELWGKKSEYSFYIKNGLAISLIIFNEKCEELSNINGISAKNFVYSLIKKILNNVMEWQQWSSIAPLLPTFAEAAPEAVLEKIENEVKIENSQLWHLFTPSKDILLGRNYYTYILWTLEQLVWYDEFAVRAILLLVTINEKNLEYKIENSPETSLYEIFCLWCPQGCLNSKDKIALLKKIIVEYPKTGWTIANSILPGNKQICMNIAKPKWHSFETDFATSVTIIEYNNTIDKLLNIMIDNLDNNIEHWEIIISKIELFKKYFEKLNKMCVAYTKKASKQDCLRLCDKLRSKISHNRRYSYDDIQIPKEYISKLEELYNKILPDELDKYKYLFKWRPDILSPIPYDKKTFDYYKETEYLFNIRKETLDRMFEKYSLDEIIEFCGNAEDVRDLAVILYKKLFESTLDLDLLMKFKNKNLNLYSEIANEIFRNIGFDEMIRKLKKSHLSEEEKANILCQTTISVENIEIIDTLKENIKNYYWSYINVYLVKSFEERNLIEKVTAKLIEYKRPFSAIKLLSRSKNIRTELIILTLEKSIELFDSVENNGMTIKHIVNYDVTELFERIYNDENVDTMTVAKLECWYLPLIKDRIKPKCIIKVLTENPSEYVNLVSKVFKSDKEIEENLSKRHDNKYDSVTNLSRDLLYLFKDIPGCNYEIKSQEIFDTWIANVKKAAEDAGYKKAIELCIGKLLSYSPVGEDGIFPHEIVRNYFEKIFIKTEIDEFVIGKYNQRGAHVLSGGINEKKIGDKYNEDAKKLRISYPNTSLILRRMSENYNKESAFDRDLELSDLWE